MTKRAEAPLPILALVGVLGLANPGFSQRPSPASDQVTLTATVRAVDAQARTLELVTGVGYALRVVKVTFADRVEMRTPSGPADLARLKAGDRVRVEYTKGVDANKATAIEVLPPPETGGAR
jgi:transcription elongation GreA/GreB family factor